MKIVHLLEPEEGRESLNTKSFAESFFLGSINLSEGNWWIILRQNFSSSFILWGKFLAVTAMEERNLSVIYFQGMTRVNRTRHFVVCSCQYLPPRSIEFDEKVLMLSQFFVKVLIGENNNTVIHFDSGSALEGEESGQNTQ